VLGPARLHWNVERFPVRVDLAQVLPSLLARWQALATSGANGADPG
jgi:hypothetical protein